MNKSGGNDWRSEGFLFSNYYLKTPMMKRFCKEMEKRILLTICIVFFSVISFATNFYVSNSGSDSNTGTSAATPWLTISKVNGASLVAGDSVLFKCGDSWFGQLLPKSGTSVGQITYGAYGTGAKPLLHLSISENNTSDWTEESTNVWKTVYNYGSEKNTNISFDTDVTTGWSSYFNSSVGASGSKIRTTKEYYSSPASLELAVINDEGIGYDIQLSMTNINLEANKTYELTFYSKATSPFLMPAIISSSQAFNTIVNPAKITTSWQKYTVYIPATKTATGNISLALGGFVLGGGIPDNTSFYLDDVHLKEIPKLLSTNDVGNVIFNNEQSVGIKTWNKVDLTTQGQYWYDAINHLLYMYSTGNPATYYTDIKACIYKNIIQLDSKDYVTIDGLAVKYGGGYGIHGGNISNLTIKNCDIAWIGGGGNSIPNFREGNGIDLYYNVNNILVEKNKIWECFDAGASNQYQSTTGTIDQYKIIYKNNSIWNCEYSFEYFNRSTTGSTHDVQFINNTCYNAGGSWGHNQRVSKNGCHLRLAGTPTNTYNVIIKNNIFHTSTERIQYNYDTSGKYTIDYNDIYQPSGDYAWLAGITHSTFAAYKSASGYDTNSINTDPLFADVSRLNFKLTYSSPCIDLGDTTSPLDPDGTRTDIGAIYLSHSTELISICDGTIYNGWTTAGEYERTLVAKTGSDSIVTTFLTVNPKYAITEDITINEGEAYNGWTESGKYTRNLTSVLGCDSIVTTNLTVESLIIKQGSIPPTHFIPVWEGENGLNHMNIMVVSAMLEDLPLSPDDEIAVFSGSICVGSMKLSETIIADINSTYLTISASQDDGSGNGFILNDTIVFKIWDNKNQLEMIAKAVVYRNNVSTWLTNGKYAAGATSVVEIVSYTEYSQTIALKKGYNMISTFVTAQDPLASDVTQSLVDAGYLIKLQDEAGNSMEDWGTFGGWINNIGSIKDTEGYKIKVSDNCSLQVTGRPIVLPLDIPLKSGWNIISFPRTDLVDAMNIIQPLIDQNILIKVQDESGNSIEDWGIFGGWKNGIGYFIPGKAYKVKMTSDAVLTIQENYLKSVLILADAVETEYFSMEIEGNGSEHMNINIVGLRYAGINAGDELAAFDGDICVGTIKITENHIIDGSAALVASFSSDELSNDGFTEGHVIQIATWNKLTGEELTVKTDVLTGQLSYAKNSSVLLKVNALTTDVNSFHDVVIIDVFPNPSQGMVTVRFSTMPDAGSSIDIVDISGRKVASRNITGMSEVFNLNQQPAGVYIVKSKLGTNHTIHKLVIN